ncbi:unnamed protein product [Ciceribacter selenitireducens ATCC BAA-1503]|uniref:Uncharacterized protein n=1 Tax=Ciceribacter selenitireducens ATCC BAA-1503 TaxID=1336235 RepID=A0A376ADY5_9HYPH|nr:unnamed protein product [Ciceribacter selenitireducens ATCC BAA-1503]
MKCGGSDYFCVIFFVIAPFWELPGMDFRFFPEIKLLLLNAIKSQP